MVSMYEVRLTFLELFNSQPIILIILIEAMQYVMANLFRV